MLVPNLHWRGLQNLWDMKFKTFGIHAILIEPGVIRTNFLNSMKLGKNVITPEIITMIIHHMRKESRKESLRLSQDLKKVHLLVKWQIWF